MRRVGYKLIGSEALTSHTSPLDILHLNTYLHFVSGLQDLFFFSAFVNVSARATSYL